MAKAPSSHPYDHFQAEARNQHIKENTIKVLLDEDYDSVPAIAAMSEEDIARLDSITNAQKGLLRVWVQKLNTQQAYPTSQGIQLHQQQQYHQQMQLPYQQMLPQLQHQMQSQHQVQPQQQVQPQSHPKQQVAQQQIEKSHPRQQQIVVAHRELDTEESLRNLTLTDTQADARHYVETRGVSNFDRFLHGKMKEFLACEVNIAVIGSAGAGKSSLINCMRNLPATDPRAAKPGSVETTTKPTPYSFPRLEKIRLWDLPGVNTPRFPKETYLDKVEFKMFDSVIIVSSERFTEDDLWLALESNKLNKSFYFIRTKIDLDVENSKRDGHADESILLANIRTDIERKLDIENLPYERVYLLSTILKYQTKWHYPKFIEDFLSKTPMRNRTVLVLAMLSCSKQVIALKAEEFRNRIDQVVQQVVDRTQDSEIIQREFCLCIKAFGITTTELEKAGMHLFSKNITALVERFENVINNPVQECQGFKWALGLGFGFVGALTLDPLIAAWLGSIGGAAGGTVDAWRSQNKKIEWTKSNESVAAEAKLVLHTFVDKCEELAIAILEAKLQSHGVQSGGTPSIRN